MPSRDDKRPRFDGSATDDEIAAAYLPERNSAYAALYHLLRQHRGYSQLDAVMECLNKGVKAIESKQK